MDFYDQVINELLSEKDNYSEKDMEMINSFYTRIHGEQTGEEMADPFISSEENTSDEEESDDQGDFSLDLEGDNS